MKLYEYTAAPNPLRVRMFLAEKEIEIEKVQVDLGKGEQFSEAFRKINPLCDVRSGGIPRPSDPDRHWYGRCGII
jgi:glutathione S-transferase